MVLRKVRDSVLFLFFGRLIVMGFVGCVSFNNFHFGAQDDVNRCSAFEKVRQAYLAIPNWSLWFTGLLF
jgi:hypothetical protein